MESKATTTSNKTTKRYYAFNSVVPFEEDLTHEFKGHKHLQEEDIPDNAWEDRVNRKGRTKKAVSQCLNGFLNAGTGGTVYLGITDDGVVKGISLTQFQKDHTKRNLEDLMSRYTPPVEEHRYKIKFFPVVEVENRSEEDIMQQVNFNSSETVLRKDRLRPHRLRTTTEECWCEYEAKAYYNHQKIMPKYVIQITIKPWDPTDSRNKYAVGVLKAHSIHEDETGKTRFRRHSLVQRYSMKEVVEYSKQLVSDHYKKEIERLKEEIYKLKMQAE